MDELKKLPSVQGTKSSILQTHQEKSQESVEDVVGGKVVEQARCLHCHAVDDPGGKDAESGKVRDTNVTIGTQYVDVPL